MTRRVRPLPCSCMLAALAVAAGLRAAEPARWWSPGEGGRLPAYATYANDYGEVGMLNTSGPIDTKGHPFFEPIGDERPRLRELSSARQRHVALGRGDSGALAGDQGHGSDLRRRRRHELPGPAGGRSEVALAAARARPVPRVPAVAAGARRRHGRSSPSSRSRSCAIPTGCNTSPRYGLTSADADDLGVSPPAPGRQYQVLHASRLRRVRRSSARGRSPPCATPRRGCRPSMNMMADARVSTLKTQADQRRADAPADRRRARRGAAAEDRRVREPGLLGAGAASHGRAA